MAESNDELKFKITLDSKSAEKSLNDVKKQGESLAELLENRLSASGSSALGDLSSVVSGRLVVALGVAGAASLALKKSLDFTIEAERMQQVKNSFEALAASSGLTASSIEEGLIAASRGLADDDEILAAANRAIVQMGENARVIPEVMELARKATALFGGDLVNNFETMNNALANGNARMLRQFGIVIDTKGAIDEYAKSLGVSSDVLTETGRKQAVANAAMEQMKQRFQSVDEETTKATTAYTRLKVSLGELGDAFKEATAQSSLWKGTLDLLRSSVEGWTYLINGPSATEAMINQGAEVQKLTRELKHLKKEYEDAGVIARIGLGNNITLVTKNLADARAEYMRMQNEMKANRKLPQSGDFVRVGAGNGAKTGKNDGIDYDLLAQKRAQAESQMQAMRNSLLGATEVLVNQNQDLDSRLVQGDILANQKREQIAADFEARKQALRVQNNQTHLLTQQQLSEAETLLESEKAARIAAIQDASTAHYQARLADLRQSMAATFQSGIVSSMQSFANALVKGGNAFEAFGGGLLSMIGDLAIQMGTFMVFGGQGLQAMFSLQPGGAIAFGAALIGLGTLLKAYGSKTSEGAGGGVAARAGGEVPAKSEMEEKKTTSVTLNVQGNILNSRDTALELIRVMNDEFSAGGSRLVVAS